MVDVARESIGAGSRRFGSMPASLLLSAPGPRRLALRAGAGAVAARGAPGAAAGDGARVPSFTSCLLGWQPPSWGPGCPA